MKNLILIVLILVSSLTYSREELWLGQWSTHVEDCKGTSCLKKEVNGYNETHDALGAVTKDGTFVMFFTNSFGDSSIAVGKKYSWREDKIFQPNIKIGGVYGYGDMLKPNIKGIAPMGFFGLDINLTDHITIGVNGIPGTLYSAGLVIKF